MRTGVAMGAYLSSTVLAAVATPLLGGRSPVLAIWLGGSVLLLLVVARSTHRGMQTSSVATRLVGVAVVATAVAVVSALIGFVLVVNIWERLGLGH
jgi:hypothetical protein